MSCEAATATVQQKAAANEYFSTRVLVNTGSTFIQAANDEYGVVGQCTWDLKGKGIEKSMIFQTSYVSSPLVMQLTSSISI